MSRVGRNCLEDDEKLREAVRLQQAPKHESDRVVSAYFDQLRLYRDACRDSKHAPCSNAVIEEKLQTVQASYEKKVRSLMKSIDRLTKENERVKRESKDHRRTAAFKRMETELGLHDALLASFADAVDQLSRDLSSLNSLCTQNVTGFVPKTTLCARDVLEQFSRKGPPRIDFKSRMELSEEAKELRCLLGNLESRLGQAKKRESESLKCFEAATKAREQESRQAREEAESAGAVIDDLRTRLAAAEAERASLESKVRTAVDKETSDIRRRLDDRSFSSEIVQLKETITRLSAEKETAVRARDSAQSELHTVLERTREETERLRALEIEFPQLQKELREAREQLVDLRGENSGLAAQVKQLQREADVQRGDAQAARGDLSELRKRYAKDVGESADLTRRSRKAETQAKAAANRIEPLQIREKQLQERNMKLGKEVAELKEQLQKAEHKNKELLYGKRIDMGGAASNKVRHLQLELLQVAEALAETAVAKESAESDRARLDALVTDLKSQLSAERTKAKGPADPAEMDILRAECEELRNENAHLLSCQEELARLERENAKLQRYVAAANFTAKQQVKEQEKRKQMQPAKGQA